MNVQNYKYIVSRLPPAVSDVSQKSLVTTLLGLRRTHFISKDYLLLVFTILTENYLTSSGL